MYELISKDSIVQKDNCPSEIRKIEDELINIFKKIYEESLSVSNNLTSLSLMNASLSDEYITAFMSVFNFAMSDR